MKNLHLFSLVWLLVVMPDSLSAMTDQMTSSTSLEVGRALYDEGKYAEAQAAFKEAVDQQDKWALAHYWLGMALYQQNQDKEALKRFKKSVRYDKKAPEGHIGMGLVYMRMKNRMMDAREAFRKAERWNKKDPDIQYQLGMINVKQSERDPLAPFYMGKARDAFMKTIDLDPNHPDAFYQLAKTYEVPPRDCYKAMPLYFQQLMVAPEHPHALEHFGSCAIAGEQYKKALGMLDQLAEMLGEGADPVIKTFRLLLTAASLEAERDFEKSLVAYEDYIASLGTDERALYTDLSYIAKDEVMTEYNWANDEVKSEIWRMFWAARDPDPSTIVNERLIEHYRRIMYARTHFSQGQYPWDRRGEIYIRYGEPNDRQRQIFSGAEGVQFFPSGNPAVDQIRALSQRQYQVSIGKGTMRNISSIGYKVESWVYVPYNLELFFSDQYNNQKYDYPIPLIEFGPQSANQPRKMAEYLIKRQPDGYQYDFGSDGPIDVAVDVVTFKEPQNKTRIEVAYSVRLGQLGQAHDGRGMLTWLDSRMVLRDDEFHHVAAVNEEIGPIERPLSERTIEEDESRIAQLAVDITPGQYRSALAIRDKTSQRVGIYELPVQVWNYSTDSLMVSDIKISSSITPSTDAGPFNRRNLEIVPNPSRTYTNDQPVYLYYEIYNLKQNEQGQTAYQTELRVTTKEEKRGFWGKIASGISKVGKIVGQSSDEQAVIITFEDEGNTRDTHKFPTIDTTDLPAGAYTITLTITDQQTQDSFSRSTDFVVAESED